MGGESVTDGVRQPLAEVSPGRGGGGSGGEGALTPDFDFVVGDGACDMTKRDGFMYISCYMYIYITCILLVVKLRNAISNCCDFCHMV